MSVLSFSEANLEACSRRLAFQRSPAFISSFIHTFIPLQSSAFSAAKNTKKIALNHQQWPWQRNPYDHLSWLITTKHGFEIFYFICFLFLWLLYIGHGHGGHFFSLSPRIFWSTESKEERRISNGLSLLFKWAASLFFLWNFCEGRHCFSPFWHCYTCGYVKKI